MCILICLIPATKNEEAWVRQLLKTGPDWWNQPNYELISENHLVLLFS